MPGDAAGSQAGWRSVYTDTLGELMVALCTQSQTQTLTPMSMIGLRYTHKASRGWGGDRVSLLQRGEDRVLVWDLGLGSAERRPRVPERYGQTVGS